MNESTPQLLPLVLSTETVEALRQRVEAVLRQGVDEAVLAQYLPRRLFHYVNEAPTRAEKTERLQKLQKDLRERQRVDVTLAQEPSANLRLYIEQWLRKFARVPMTLVIGINPDIVGGVMIGVGGKWHDYSLRVELPSYEKLSRLS